MLKRKLYFPLPENVAMEGIVDTCVIGRQRFMLSLEEMIVQMAGHRAVRRISFEDVRGIIKTPSVGNQQHCILTMCGCTLVALLAQVAGYSLVAFSIVVLGGCIGLVSQIDRPILCITSKVEEFNITAGLLERKALAQFAVTFDHLMSRYCRHCNHEEIEEKNEVLH